jgi:DNA polymerase III subunit delta'
MKRLHDIFGQDAVIAALRGAMAAGRLAHGLIFAGSEGIGKATTAGAMGAFFLCDNPGREDACGKCDSCRAIAAGTHPDFHVISKELARVYDRSGTSKATLLSITVIRHALAEPAGRKTVLGKGKVFIVEQAELMTPQAQNALLKTLEEPAGRTLIILLTTHANELLSTIRSRCPAFPFAPLKTDLVVRELKKRGIEAAKANTAAELADGSLGVALRWIEDDILTSAEEVVHSVDSALAGKASDLGDLLRKRADAYAQKVLDRDELASKDSATRNGLAMYLGIAARRIRARLLEPNVSERACSAIEAIARAEKYLDANVNVAIVMEQLTAAV